MADGDITIITTIHPAKNGRRPITVAAAAEGDLPTLLNGAFPERHALADQAYSAVLKAQAAAVAKADKKKASGKKAAKPQKKSTPAADGRPGFGEPGHLPTLPREPETVRARRTAEPDQFGPADANQGTESPLVNPPAALPVIEGDDQAQLELEGIDG